LASILKSLYAKFQPSSFKTEGGDREWHTVKLQNFKQPPFLLLIFAKLQDENSKIWLITFFSINIKSLCAKFQPSSFITEGEDRGWWTGVLWKCKISNGPLWNKNFNTDFRYPLILASHMSASATAAFIPEDICWHPKVPMVSAEENHREKTLYGQVGQKSRAALGPALLEEV